MLQGSCWGRYTANTTRSSQSKIIQIFYFKINSILSYPSLLKSTGPYCIVYLTVMLAVVVNVPCSCSRYNYSPLKIVHMCAKEISTILYCELYLKTWENIYSIIFSAPRSPPLSNRSDLLLLLHCRMLWVPRRQTIQKAQISIPLNNLSESTYTQTKIIFYLLWFPTFLDGFSLLPTVN